MRLAGTRRAGENHALDGLRADRPHLGAVAQLRLDQLLRAGDHPLIPAERRERERRIGARREAVLLDVVIMVGLPRPDRGRPQHPFDAEQIGELHRVSGRDVDRIFAFQQFQTIRGLDDHAVLQRTADYADTRLDRPHRGRHLRIEVLADQQHVADVEDLLAGERQLRAVAVRHHRIICGASFIEAGDTRQNTITPKDIVIRHLAAALLYPWSPIHGRRLQNDSISP